MLLVSRVQVLVVREMLRTEKLIFSHIVHIFIILFIIILEVILLIDLVFIILHFIPIGFRVERTVVLVVMVSIPILQLAVVSSCRLIQKLVRCSVIVASSCSVAVQV